MNLRGLLFLAPIFVACGGNVSEDSRNDVVPAAPAARTGSSNAATNDGATSCDNSPVAACAAAAHVSTPEALIAMLKKVAYQETSVTKGTLLAVGNDITADEDIEVTSSGLPPVSCPREAGAQSGPLNPPPCHEPMFGWSNIVGANEIAGVSCLEEGDGVRSESGCIRLKIAKGTTFRLRGIIVDQHPWELFPFVELLASCASPCAPSEVRCAKTNVCMSVWEHCMDCEGKTSAYCSCLGDDCQMKPSGTVCHYSLSPDQPATGMCTPTGCFGDARP